MHPARSASPTSPDRRARAEAPGTARCQLAAGTAPGIPHDLKACPEARHSFFNGQWRTCDPAAAAGSWQRIQAIFGEHVQRRPPGSG